MGAKFIVDRRCTVKTSLTLTGLIEGLKQQGLLRRVTELTAAGALPTHEPDARIDLVLPEETGVASRLTFRELREQTAALAEYRSTCRQCQSSLNGYVGGCIAYVPYPVSEGMEYLLWLTAVQGLKGRLPDLYLDPAKTLAQRAQRLERTPFADGLRARGDLLSARPRLYTSGRLWQKERLTSAQVLDAFFVNGVLAEEDLQVHMGFLGAALAVAAAMEPVMSTEEKRAALVEDVEPYTRVLALMEKALDQGLGVYVWP